MVEDYKETAPCGILIHYSVDSTTDFLTYNDINGRGEERISEKCYSCSWRAVCKPTSNKLMTLEGLIEKFKKEGNFIYFVLFNWVSHIEQDDNYYSIYGFIWGLCAVNFISEQDRDSLLDQLISLF